MRYWVKLWTEMLDDPKMGRLTDRQHRLCTNLFCLAGLIDDDGRLLSTEDIAYRARRDIDSVAEDLDALTSVNIIEHIDGAWHLVHFDERNERPPSYDSTERVRQYRERRKQAGMPAGYTYDPAEITTKYGCCVYCGSTDNLVVDHAYPIAQGGTDDQRNLVAACKKCNAGKAGRTPEQARMQFIDAEAERLYMEYKQTVTVAPLHDNGYSNNVTPPEKRRSDQTRKEGEKNNNVAANAAPPSPAASKDNGRPKKDATPLPPDDLELIKQFLGTFNALRFKNTTQAEAVIALGHEYGGPKVLEAAKWAALKGMGVSAAIGAIGTALPTWGQKHSRASPQGVPEPKSWAAIRAAVDEYNQGVTGGNLS